MKTKSEELNLIWDDLKRIFMGYKGLSERVIRELESFGFTITRNGAHVKINMPVGTMIISNTPSDKHAGRQILRQIRRMYEKDKTLGN